jgi:flagellin
MISFQTNVASMVGQDNLETNTNFQTQTIEQLTSGYRINSAGDDAAGLTVANQYRSSIAELTQGVLNANDGASTLQIMDGGLSNISNMLDRLSTLATESATSTFTGNRDTLNNEYQSLLSEINRQAQNIQLNQGGTNNALLSVFIGGASQAASADAQVTVNLSGQAVDSSSLGLASTSVAGGGNSIKDSGGAVNLTTATSVLANNESQSFTVNYTNSSGGASNLTVTVNGTGTGITPNDALGQINSQLAGLGISASINQTTGALEFSGNNAFSVNGTGGAYTDGIFSNAGTVTADNQALYTATSSIIPTASPAGEEFSLVTSNNQTIQLSLSANDTTAAKTVADINSQSAALGITASVNSAGKVQLSSSNAFTMVQTSAATVGANDLFGGSTGNITVNAPAASSSATGNAQSALTAIQDAVQLLGTVQGKVGTGENMLQYAIDLANSQITNFSAAESNIRDANIAAEAANLSKAQVLQQSSIAAMAQANSSPQAVLKLLQQ